MNSYYIESPQTRIPDSELLKTLSEGAHANKIKAMYHVLSQLSQGLDVSQFLVPVIQYVVTSKSKVLKKMSYLFFEQYPVYTSDGGLISEVYLLCNALRNNLLHANEYIRGYTLGFVRRLPYRELLLPLLPTVLDLLNDSHWYVRYNAVDLLTKIYAYDPKLVVDYEELIREMLKNESNERVLRVLFTAAYSINKQLLLDHSRRLLEVDVSIEVLPIVLLLADTCDRKTSDELFTLVLSLHNKELVYGAAQWLVRRGRLAQKTAQALARLLKEEYNCKLRSALVSLLEALYKVRSDKLSGASAMLIEAASHLDCDGSRRLFSLALKVGGVDSHTLIYERAKNELRRASEEWRVVLLEALSLVRPQIFTHEFVSSLVSELRSAPKVRTAALNLFSAIAEGGLQLSVEVLRSAREANDKTLIKSALLYVTRYAEMSDLSLLAREYIKLLEIEPEDTLISCRTLIERLQQQQGDTSKEQQQQDTPKEQQQDTPKEQQYTPKEEGSDGLKQLYKVLENAKSFCLKGTLFTHSMCTSISNAPSSVFKSIADSLKQDKRGKRFVPVWSAPRVRASSDASKFTVKQLTGLGEPVYVEAIVVQQRELLVLDMLIVNKTEATLQNVHVLFTSSSDIRQSSPFRAERIGPKGFITREVKFSIVNVGRSIVQPILTYGNSMLTLDHIVIDPSSSLKPLAIDSRTFSNTWLDLPWEATVQIATVSSAKTLLTELEARLKLVLVSSIATAGIVIANLACKTLNGDGVYVNVAVRVERGLTVGKCMLRSNNKSAVSEFTNTLHCIF